MEMFYFQSTFAKLKILARSYVFIKRTLTTFNIKLVSLYNILFLHFKFKLNLHVPHRPIQFLKLVLVYLYINL